MINTEPLVSIIVLCYNQENTISKCLESIISQDLNVKFEVLIGDDASTDGTSEICEKFALKYNNIIYVKRKKNIGMINNYIDIIKRAKGIFVAQCAGDDFWIDNYKLQKQIDFLNCNHTYGMVHTNYKVLSKNKLKKSNIFVPTEYIFDNLLNSNFICAPTIMIKKDILTEAINENVINKNTVIEDYTLWLFTSQFYKIGYLDDITSVYRKNINSISNFEDVKDENNFINSMINIQISFAKKNKKIFILKERIKNHYNFMIYESINKRTTFNINQGFSNLIKIRSLNFHYIKYYLYHFFLIKPVYLIFKKKFQEPK